MTRFCRDLNKIQINTFKKITILSAFEKSRMYSIDYTACIGLLWKYVSGNVLQKKSRKDDLSLSTPAASLLKLELPRICLQTLHEIKVELNLGKQKIEVSYVQCSDLVREKKLNQYVSSTQQVIVEFYFKDYKLSFHYKRQQDELLQKTTSRKQLKLVIGVLSIIKKDALTAITEKRRKENDLAKKREHNMYIKFGRSEQDNVLAKEIIAQKDEKAKIKKIKNYTKRKVKILDEDKNVIVNPKVEGKTTNLIGLAEKVRKTETKKKYRPRITNQEDEENDDNFIIDIVDDREQMLRDPILANDDYVRFEETDSSDDDVQLHLGLDGLLIDSLKPWHLGGYISYIKFYFGIK